MSIFYIFLIIFTRKNDFAKTYKNLATDQKIIMLDHQNNYVGNLKMNKK